MYVSPLRAKPLLRYVFSSINNVQDSITLVCPDFPILHLEMELAKNARFQRPKISVKTSAYRFRRARKCHEPQSLLSTFANRETTHQTLKSPPLLLRINMSLAFNVASELKIKSSSAQFSGD